MCFIYRAACVGVYCVFLFCDEIGDFQTFNGSESTDAYCTRMRTDVRTADRMSAHQLFWQCSAKHCESGLLAVAHLVFPAEGRETFVAWYKFISPKKEPNTDILLILFDKVSHWMVPIPANYFKLTHLLFALQWIQTNPLVSKNTLFYIIIIPYNKLLSYTL